MGGQVSSREGLSTFTVDNRLADMFMVEWSVGFHVGVNLVLVLKACALPLLPDTIEVTFLIPPYTFQRLYSCD